MSRPPPSQLGDCLRALVHLRPGEPELDASIARLLGLARRTAVDTAPGPERAALLTNEADDDDDAVIAQPQHRPRAVASDATAAPIRDADLALDTADHEAARQWLAEAEPLAAPTRVADPFSAAREPLFDAKLQPALLARLAATWQASGELDLAKVVAQVSACRPLRTVPRRAVATTLRGVRLLVDQSESMQPFQQDVVQLVRSFRRTVGSSRLRVESFLNLLSRDVRIGMDWRAYRPGHLGMGLVLISDLGLPPRPLTSAPVTTDEWRRFLAREQRTGVSPLVIVARDRAGLPAALKRHARLIPWDRRSSPRTLAAACFLGGEARAETPDVLTHDSVSALNPLATLDDATLRLASACALAVRVAPPLLRAMRLALDLEGGVDLEARLWFSAVVRDRAVTGLVFDDESRELLLQRLRSDEALLETSWRLISHGHASLAPALRAEEEACYHWLRGDNDAARAVLRSMVATVVDPSRAGAWRWASQAVARLPRALLQVDEAQMFAMGTALRSGEGQLLRHVDSRGGGAWNWLRPAVREIELAVTLRVGVIEFSPTTSRPSLRMRVPDAPVVLIDIRPLFDHGEMKLARVNPRQRTLVDVEGSDFQLQVLGGERYQLRERRVAAVSNQKFVARKRVPCVQIEYDLEMDDKETKVRLPFVMGVLSGLSGRPAEPQPAVVDRKFFEIDIANFDVRMKAILPRVAFEVENTLNGEGHLGIDIVFESLEDFSPVAVLRRVDVLANMLQTRAQLADLLTDTDGNAGAEKLLAQMLGDPALLRQLTAAEAPPLSSIVYRGSDLASLLAKAVRPRSDASWHTVEQAVRTLAVQASQSGEWTVSDVAAGINKIIANIDRSLSVQLNLILHHDDFKTLEGAWRGLHYLVVNTETDEELKIKVFNVTKVELSRSLRRYKGAAWDASPLFEKVYEHVFGQFGGQPFGCLVGDYHFDHSLPDVEMLAELAKIAAASHAPFITGASPAIAQMNDWRELSDRWDMANAFVTPEYAGWWALRESEEARYLGLTMPRFLSRVPYGAGSNPIEEFDFEEHTGGNDGEDFVWSNSAYAMAVNINRAFKLYGWCASIRGVESGGAVEGLPVHSFTNSDGSVDTKSPIEVAITDRREAELSRAGFLPLMQRKNTDAAYFVSAQSLQKTAVYDDPDATANATLAARLPYLFAGSRFVQYLKCIARDKIGSFSNHEQLQRLLNVWIMQYVTRDPHASEFTRARYPLAEALVELDDEDLHLGYFTAKIYLRPHYQLEGLTLSLRMVTRLPAA